MPAIVLYLIKLSCSLAITWLFYRLVLRSLTFYTWNRWYLLGYAFLSTLVPLVDVGRIFGEDPAREPLIIQYIPVIGRPLPATAAPVASYATHWDAWSVLLLLLALGSCVLLLRFLIRYYSLRNLRRRAVLLQQGPVNIYHIPGPVSPFSFGNSIYVNPDQHSEKEWAEIILHEYVHIRERHTLDILFGELLVIVNWYNPFAWLIRYSIRQNLEFIADRAVIDNGFDKQGYQYHLLKVVGQANYKLANNFNFSSLKKRIIMMNKLRSARLHLIRFLFILPLLTVLLVAFRNRIPVLQPRKDIFVNVAGIVISVPDRKAMAGVAVRELISGVQTITDDRGYYKLRIRVKGDSARLKIDYIKAGYDGEVTNLYLPSIKQSKGMCDVGFMGRRSASGMPIYTLSRMEEPPADPGYEDALKGLKWVKPLDRQVLLDMIQKTHPEVLRSANSLPQRSDTSKPLNFKMFAGRTDPDLHKALWIVDGAIKPQSWYELDSINKLNVVSMNIYSGDQAKLLFGDKGSEGVIFVITRSSQQNLPQIVTLPTQQDPPLYVVDGVTVSYNPLDSIEPGKIHSVVVPRPGVVMVQTKRSIPHIVMETKDANGQPMTVTADSIHTPEGDFHIQNGLPAILHPEASSAGSIRVTPGGNFLSHLVQLNPLGSQPLYIVDGIEVGNNVVQNLDPAEITSITVLQNKAGVAIYGDRAANGVVSVTTKKSAQSTPQTPK
jgi:hypothetical protein